MLKYSYMDQEDKKIIRKNFEMTLENNKMLKKIRRSMFLSNVTRLFYWVVIIGLSLGAYYYLQPYIDGAKETFDQIRGGVGVVSDGITTTTQTTNDAIESVLDFTQTILSF